MTWPTAGALSVASTRPMPCIPSRLRYSKRPTTTSSSPTNCAKAAAFSANPYIHRDYIIIPVILNTIVHDSFPLDTVSETTRVVLRLLVRTGFFFQRTKTGKSVAHYSMFWALQQQMHMSQVLTCFFVALHKTWLQFNKHERSHEVLTKKSASSKISTSCQTTLSLLVVNLQVSHIPIKDNELTLCMEAVGVIVWLKGVRVPSDCFGVPTYVGLAVLCKDGTSDAIEEPFCLVLVFTVIWGTCSIAWEKAFSFVSLAIRVSGSTSIPYIEACLGHRSLQEQFLGASTVKFKRLPKQLTHNVKVPFKLKTDWWEGVLVRQSLSVECLFGFNLVNFISMNIMRHTFTMKDPTLQCRPCHVFLAGVWT